MKRDQILVEKLLSAYNRHHGTLYSVVRRPEESNRKTEAMEAVAANALGQTIAFEHTLIEPFVGEREDTDRLPNSKMSIAQAVGHKPMTSAELKSYESK